MDNNNIMEELHFMQQAYATLYSVVNKVQTCGDVYMGDLTSRQHMAMLAIVHLPTKQTTLINIANMLGATKQTTSTLINSLSKKGFVKSVPSKVDKRAINIELTEAGKLAMVSGSEQSVYFLADMFHEFTSDEIKIFWGLLQKLYRFDGETQHSFEDKAEFDSSDISFVNAPDYQEKVIAEFMRRRNINSDKEDKE